MGRDSEVLVHGRVAPVTTPIADLPAFVAATPDASLDAAAREERGDCLIPRGARANLTRRRVDGAEDPALRGLPRAGQIDEADFAALTFFGELKTRAHRRRIAYTTGASR